MVNKNHNLNHLIVPRIGFTLIEYDTFLKSGEAPLIAPSLLKKFLQTTFKLVHVVNVMKFWIPVVYVQCNDTACPMSSLRWGLDTVQSLVTRNPRSNILYLNWKLVYHSKFNLVAGHIFIYQ